MTFDRNGLESEIIKLLHVPPFKEIYFGNIRGNLQFPFIHGGIRRRTPLPEYSDRENQSWRVEYDFSVIHIGADDQRTIKEAYDYVDQVVAILVNEDQGDQLNCKAWEIEIIAVEYGNIVFVDPKRSEEVLTQGGVIKVAFNVQH